MKPLRPVQAVGIILLLSGCVTYAERIEAAHHKRCVTEFGARPGTSEYGYCKLALAQQEQLEQANWVAALGTVQQSLPQPPMQVELYHYNLPQPARMQIMPGRCMGPGC